MVMSFLPKPLLGPRLQYSSDVLMALVMYIQLHACVTRMKFHQHYKCTVITLGLCECFDIIGCHIASSPSCSVLRTGRYVNRRQPRETRSSRLPASCTCNIPPPPGCPCYHSLALQDPYLTPQGSQGSQGSQGCVRMRYPCKSAPLCRDSSWDEERCECEDSLFETMSMIFFPYIDRDTTRLRGSVLYGIKRLVSAWCIACGLDFDI